MKKLLIIPIIFTSLAVVFSCGGKNNAETTVTSDDAHGENHESSNIATLTDEQIKSIGLELGAIEQKQLTASLKTNGVLKVPNQNRASVNSVYNGVVKSLL